MASPSRYTRWAPLWFTSPAIFLMFVILIFPILIAVGLSFTDFALGKDDWEWVGTKWYERIGRQSRYEKMFTATAIYVVTVVPLSIILGLLAALAINGMGRFGDLYMTVYFLPVMATLIAMAIAWEFALHPTRGMINIWLKSGCGSFLEVWPWYAHHCAEGFPNWITDKRYAIYVVCFIGVWQGFGFNMVLFLAGLTSIPRDLYHAAEMDGAKSAWERFRLVTWPMLGPTTVFVVTITFIKSFQVFDLVEAMLEHGGPSKSAYVILYAIYEQGIQFNRLGLASALTVIFLVFVLIATLAQRWLVDRRTHYV